MATMPRPKNPKQPVQIPAGSAVRCPQCRHLWVVRQAWTVTADTLAEDMPRCARCQRRITPILVELPEPSKRR